jgi:protease I
MRTRGMLMLGLVAGLAAGGCRNDRYNNEGAHPGSTVPASREGRSVVEVDTTHVNRNGRLAGLHVGILATDGFEQSELVEPRQAFVNEGARTTVVSPKGGTIQGYRHGEKADSVKVDMLLADARPELFDALQLPGGVVNSDKLRLEPAAIELVGAFANGHKPIAAICHGLWTMADADVLMGRKVTSWPSLKTDLTNAGAHWEDKPVVDDANFVTSRKPDDIPLFNEHAILMFAKYSGKPAIGGGPTDEREP